MNEPARTLFLRPEHMTTLAAAEPTGLVGAQIYKAGQFCEAGFAQYGRLEFLANCGLVEFIAKAGRRSVEPGDVWIYYFLTEHGRGLLRWRAGAGSVGSAGRRRARPPSHQVENAPPP